MIHEPWGLPEHIFFTHKDEPNLIFTMYDFVNWYCECYWQDKNCIFYKPKKNLDKKKELDRSDYCRRKFTKADGLRIFRSLKRLGDTGWRAYIISQDNGELKVEEVIWKDLY